MSRNKAARVQGLYPFSGKPERKEGFSFPAHVTCPDWSSHCRAQMMAVSVRPVRPAMWPGLLPRKGWTWARPQRQWVWAKEMPQVVSATLLWFSVSTGIIQLGVIEEWTWKIRKRARQFTHLKTCLRSEKWSKEEEQCELCSASLDYMTISEICLEWNSKIMHLRTDKLGIDLFVADIRTVISYRKFCGIWIGFIYVHCTPRIIAGLHSSC